MLTKDPTKRATVEDLIENDWLTNKGREPINIYKPMDTVES